VRTNRSIIKDTALRAIKLEQLRQVVGHMRRRLQGEAWLVSREVAGKWCTHELTEPHKVHLYDLNSHVIKPATYDKQCSMVELIATEEQAPEYFVSHWWGEPVVEFLACLEQHAKDRGLHPDYAAYWVCAYANCQWRLAEELPADAPLDQTPFYRAMSLPTTKGTVSVLDKNGVCFTRIWCVYELFTSLVGDFSSACTYDMYTVSGRGDSKVPVGITMGLATVDEDAMAKGLREQHFPIELLDRGISFECREGETTEEGDKIRILATIEQNGAAEKLDCIVHSYVAGAGMRRALEEGGDRLRQYMAAVQCGQELPKSLVMN